MSFMACYKKPCNEVRFRGRLCEGHYALFKGSRERYKGVGNNLFHRERARLRQLGLNLVESLMKLIIANKQRLFNLISRHRIKTWLPFQYMQTIDIGDQVRVRLAGGAIKRGKVVSISYSGYKGQFTEYGIQFEDKSYPMYYEESDLIKEYSMGYWLRCTCGGEKVGAPGHSPWCDKSEFVDEYKD